MAKNTTPMKKVTTSQKLRKKTSAVGKKVKQLKMLKNGRAQMQLVLQLLVAKLHLVQQKAQSMVSPLVKKQLKKQKRLSLKRILKIGLTLLKKPY